VANAKYSAALASGCYINIAEDGGAKAGMILENGEVLTVELPVGEDRAESTRKTLGNCPAHQLILEREGGSFIRRSFFFGGDGIVEEFAADIPRGRDYWHGGSRRY